MATPVLFRQALGETLRQVRQERGLTLRWVSGQAQLSLGYLSEIERGQKEVSSEILEAIADSLGLPLSAILQRTACTLAAYEGIYQLSATVKDAYVHPVV